MKQLVVVLLLSACSEPEPDARSIPTSVQPDESFEGVSGAHPGPIELPHARTMSTMALDPRLLGDVNEGAGGEPAFDEAPLDLSVIGQDGRGFGQRCHETEPCAAEFRCCDARCVRPVQGTCP